MLNTAGYELMVKQLGTDFEWLKAMPCSCYDPRQNYDAQAGCTACVHGYVYRSQGIRRGLVGNRTTRVLHPEMGWVPVSEVTLTTIPTQVPFGRFDKVVLQNHVARERVRVAREDNAITVGSLVEVTEIADDSTTYTEGTDYTVDLATGIVTWITAGPSNVYAADVLFRPVYWYIGENGQPEIPAGGGRQTPVIGTLSQAPVDS